MLKLISLILSFISVLTPITQLSTNEPKTSELTVLMYHHISEKSSLLNDYTITPEEFEKDMKYLSDNGCKSVTTSQIISGTIPEKAVMITFDDGFLSTYKYAKPILEKYNMTGVCAIIGSVMTEYTEHPNTISDCAYMDIETVRAMIESDTFEIACHTYDMHKNDTRKGCSKLNWESDEEYKTVLTEDLSKFNELYMTSFGTSTDIIAFPYGRYSEETVKIASDCGYKIMLTCNEKINYITADGTTPIILGRFNRPYGKTTEEFFAYVFSK